MGREGLINIFVSLRDNIFYNNPGFIANKFKKMKKIFCYSSVAAICLLSLYSFSQVVTKEKQVAMTPLQALKKLKKGNERFMQNTLKSRNWHTKVQLTAAGQYPFATILGCMDSRAPSEIIFDQGLGDVFNIRVAGNIVNEDILGSLEYACKVAGSKLLVVLGHTECGAIKGAIDHVQLGNLTVLLNKISPAVTAVDYNGTKVSSDKSFVKLVTVKNIEMAIEEIRAKSEILKEMESKGEIKIVGAVYDVATGKVSWL
jgi:carbonic anhydrase